MEALLPSEIARLVFGYLEDQKCDEAAKSFLAMSPHLQECRAMVTIGRRFSTRVNGLRLVDIFEKFSAANAIVQERLSKVADCEQLKHCGDLLEQLRFLLDGSRGQRFIVNINVPSQANAQVSSGSPILSSGMRKRHHNGSDRERCKRSTHFQTLGKRSEPVSSQLGCDTVEATPLESLPGHIDYPKSTDYKRFVTTGLEKHGNSNKNNISDCLQTMETETFTLSSNDVHSHQKYEAQVGGILQEERGSNLNGTNQEKRHKLEERERPFSICTATSTEELMSYTCVEVQTTPYDIPESESESNNEPIENLSVLTKELLNRTELQERIADNINKAILPTQMPLKDDSLCESMGGELNTSVMLELNTAIKSIVKATETDPVFEKFLSEMIGSNGETDTSPDEDADLRVNTELQDRQIVHETDLQEPVSVPTKLTYEIGISEVPLKQRLRSSSRQQNVRAEDEGDKQKEFDKEDTALDDQNAAAILSIINANAVDDKLTDGKTNINDLVQLTSANTENEKKTTETSVMYNLTEKEPVQAVTSSTAMECQEPSTTVPVTNNVVGCKTTKKLPIKKVKPAKSNRKPNVNQEKLISEQEMMAMPTLIVCSKEEITNLLSSTPSYSAGNTESIISTSHFVPIAPKDPYNPPIERIYLKTVNVPQKMPVNPSIISNIETTDLSKGKAVQLSGKRSRKMKKSKTEQVIDKSSPIMENPVCCTVESTENNKSGIESITLYGGENSIGTMLSANMPMINLEESFSFCGTGLSPFLKFNASRTNQDQCEVVTEQEPKDTVTFDSKDTDNLAAEPTSSNNTEQAASLVLNNCDLITKRTPRSLLKSRSKNYRLSLSTPRRRNSHVRALDFNTPTKISSSGRKLNGTENTRFSSKSVGRTKSMCRTSLFKSPPFSNPAHTTQKLKNSLRISRSYKVPIATRSPAPKLMGGWEKYTGVGMILGSTSPQSTSTSTSPNKNQSQSSTKPQVVVKKSWDADLRKVIQSQEDETLLLKKFNSKEQETNENKIHAASCKSKTTEKTSKDEQTKQCANDNEKCSKLDGTNNSNSKNHEAQTSLKELNQVASNNEPDAVLTLEDKSEKSVRGSVTVADENLKKDVINIIADTNAMPRNNVNVAYVTAQSASSNNAKIIETVNVPNKSTNQTTEKKTVKKYAQLKTIKTNIKATFENADKSELTVKTVDTNMKEFESLKVSPEVTQQSSQISCMLDLKTPRKIENSSGIPPTPRLLSPNSNIITPFMKVNEDSSKVRSFITTPEFPPTPNIVLTPKHIEENTKATDKGDSNICSPYYQPSIEQSKIPDKLLDRRDDQIENNLQKILNTVPVTMEMCVTTINSNIANDFQTITSNNKLEITQFEVIKENLPREEAVKELKISTNSKDSVIGIKSDTDNLIANDLITDVVTASATLECNVLKELNEDGTSDSENESSDTSDTSSSSDSTSSSSSSSSSSCGTNTSTPFKLTQKYKKTPNKIYTDTNSSSAHKKPVPKITDKSTNNTSTVSKSDVPQQQEVTKKIEDNVTGTGKDNDDTPSVMVASLMNAEISPLKVFSVTRAEDGAETSLKETPAKDETLLSEANISETPSGSKSGVETLSNLNSKISALTTANNYESDVPNCSLDKVHEPPSKATAQPKTVNVQRVLPNDSTVVKPVMTSELISSTVQRTQRTALQPTATLDGKLSLHLEEKRQRLIAKLKTKPQLNLATRRPHIKSNISEEKEEDKTLGDNKYSVEKQSRDTEVCSKNLDTRKIKITKDNVEKRSMGTVENRTSVERIDKDIPSKENKNAKLKNEAKETLQCKVILENTCYKEQKCNKRSTVSHNVHSERNKWNKEKDDTKKVTDSTISKHRMEGLKVDKANILTKKEREKERNNLSSTVQENNKTKIKIKRNSVDNLKNKNVKDENNKDIKVKESNVKEVKKDEKVCPKYNFFQEGTTNANVLQKISDCNEKDVGDKKEHVSDKPKCGLKHKVDQIKRDLFSNEENNKQITTRSKTRQISDAQKNNSVDSNRSTLLETVDRRNSSEIPKEELSCVLECLNLVPASKNEIIEEEVTSNLNATFCNSVEYHFVYDDTISIRKRKRKYSNSDLEFQVSVELTDQNYAECTKLMSATAYEEIFNISPASRRKVAIRKPSIKSIKSIRMDLAKLKNSTAPILKNNHIKPLASSSPEIKSSISKVDNVIPKDTVTNKKAISQPLDSKEKQVTNNVIKEKEKQKLNTKSRKRKILDTKESEQIEKKLCKSDPQALLNSLNVDEFLTSVHGPV